MRASGDSRPGVATTVLRVRPNDEHDDFYDPDVPTDADPSRLRRVILAQAHEPGGAAVLLFTTATLTEVPGPGDGVDTADGTADAGADLVTATATDLHLDAVPPDLFTADAYLLQSALGERLLPEDA